MGKGRFVNQKLGKRVSRKSSLLKSELVGRGDLKVVSAISNLPAAKKEILRGKV